MSNIVPTGFFDAAGLANALENNRVDLTEQGGTGTGFLQFNFRNGDWTFGKDKDIVTDEEVLLFPSGLKHGWVLWVDGVSTKVMVDSTQPLPPAPEAQRDRRNVLQSPQEARALAGAFLMDGQPFIWDTNSMGGRQTWNAYVHALIERFHAVNKDTSALFCKARLTSRSYFNERRQEDIHNPVLELLAWCDETGKVVSEIGQAQLAAPQKEEKVKAKEPEPEAEPAVEPQRRRRRSAA